MAYVINEGALPMTPIEDRSMNVLTLENSAGSAPLQAIVTRDSGEPGETLNQSVDRQIKMLSRQVAGFKKISSEELQITEAKWPAILREHSFRQGTQSAHQIQIVAQTPTTGFLIFTLSCSTSLTEAHRQEWIKIVSEFRPNDTIAP